MGNVAVVGAQWGDEGKGKIVDWLSERADVVVRFQGGHNAGHTLVIGNVEYKLSLLPSGVVRPGKLSIIGNGVVVDPWALIDEIDAIRAKGVDVEPAEFEARRQRRVDPAVARRARPRPRGTARRQQDRHDRPGHRSGLRGQGRAPGNPGLRPRRPARRSNSGWTTLLLHHNALLRGLGEPEIDRARADCRSCARSRLASCPMPSRCGACSTRRAHTAGVFCSRARRGRCSTSITALIPTSPHRIRWPGRPRPDRGSRRGRVGFVLGITKAYTTRVGTGPFPTELKDEIGETLGERGREFGVVTGRKRRCGWFDAVAVRQAVKTGGISGIALTKLDVLDGFEEIKICTAYRRGGEDLRLLPRRNDSPGRGRAGLRNRRGLARKHPRRAVMGRSAGDRDQIHQTAGRADRRPCRPSVDQPRTRRYRPGA